MILKITLQVGISLRIIAKIIGDRKTKSNDQATYSSVRNKDNQKVVSKRTMAKFCKPTKDELPMIL